MRWSRAGDPRQEKSMPVDIQSRVIVRDTLGKADLPAWLERSHATLCESLVDSAYPCYLGTAAEKLGELLISYVDGGDREHLPDTLTSFLRISAAHPDQRLALALFFEPDEVPKSLEQYHGEFWDTLQFLHDHDAIPWPPEQPRDPADPNWEFTFAGTPMFVFVACPGYDKRRSRNLGPGLLLLFQPRLVFVGMEGGTPPGIKTRKIIRKRLTAWDHMDTHPDMGSYGDPSNYEWKQYCLPDDNAPTKGQCPLHLHQEVGVLAGDPERRERQ